MFKLCPDDELTVSPSWSPSLTAVGNLHELLFNSFPDFTEAERAFY